MAFSWSASDDRPFLLVSDVDDTLKRTHRLSKTGMIKKGMRSRNAFAGMAELYNHYSTYGLLDSRSKQIGLKYRSCVHNPRRLVSYVTGAIGKFQWFSCLFLVRSNFPMGIYLGRETGASYEFKVSAIRKLIDDFPNYTPIFVGDNGEDDPKVFEVCRSWFAEQGREAHFFVHKVYPKSLPEGQHPFLTAVDLGLQFFNLDLIDEEGLLAVTNAVHEAFHDNSRRVLPRWVLCSDVETFWPEPKKPIHLDLKRKIEAIRRLVIRCMNKAEANPRSAHLLEFS